jgi:hypothetical protein
MSKSLKLETINLDLLNHKQALTVNNINKIFQTIFMISVNKLYY